MSDKTRWEGRDQQLGARIRIVWTLFRALGSAKENICALESLKGYIVSGCWELKRKFRVIEPSAFRDDASGKNLRPIKRHAGLASEAGAASNCEQIKW